MRKIQISPHKSSWKRLYKKEEKILQDVLHEEISFVAHIGSADTPDFKAKTHFVLNLKLPIQFLMLHS
ncbi:MAG: GrpB family protein [Gammaproteobacteria bacterium]|nr:GrpB family protein [Gammaproteobacteria bacterium]